MFSNVYDNLKTYSVMAINYNFLYIIRRTIFITIMFNPWLQTDECVQVILLTYLNGSILIYLTYHLPYETEFRNWNEIINECTVFISTESMLLYTTILAID